MSENIAPQHGDLRIWHIPQIPGKPFIVRVASPADAKRLLDVLADYDTFQFENNIRTDYSNAAGLSVFDTDDKNDGSEGSWIDWYSDDGEELDDLTSEQLLTAKWEE